MFGGGRKSTGKCLLAFGFWLFLLSSLLLLLLLIVDFYFSLLPFTFYLLPIPFSSFPYPYFLFNYVQDNNICNKSKVVVITFIWNEKQKFNYMIDKLPSRSFYK